MIYKLIIGIGVATIMIGYLGYIVIRTLDTENDTSFSREEQIAIYTRWGEISNRICAERSGSNSGQGTCRTVKFHYAWGAEGEAAKEIVEIYNITQSELNVILNNVIDNQWCYVERQAGIGTYTENLCNYP